MKKLHFLFIVAIIGVFVLSCASNGNQQVTDNSKDIRGKISNACFEIVIKKPEKDSLTYEKDLPWDLISFNRRNDKYVPIGTAFAISDRELLTAAHVLNLIDDSISFSDYYIRDKNGDVYEIYQILSFHSSKDFIKFNAKNIKFSSWFNLRKNFEFNESIFAVGNIYGEGLVAAPGTLLGSIPESENGKWVYLKSSPPNDKGSSGGLLLDKSGNVIGIIIAKDNNFSYSLPVGEMTNQKENSGIFHKNFIYGFDLFPERTEHIAFDIDVKLPRYYKEIKQYINFAYSEHYQQNMQKLFDDNKSEIFPKGKSSLKALNEDSNNYTMQVLFKDKDDKNWYFSDLKKETSSLDRNGMIRYTKINSTLYIDIEKPDNIKVDFDENLLKIDNKSKLGLLYDFYPDDGKLVWGLREVFYEESEKDNYFILSRHIKPHIDLPDSYKNTWENIVQKGHPYNEVPYLKNGRTNIGQIYPNQGIERNDSAMENQFVFSLYIGKEGSIKEKRIKANLQTLKEGIKIKSDSRLANIK